MALDFPNRDTGALLRLKGQFELMRTAVADPKAKGGMVSAKEHAKLELQLNETKLELTKSIV